MYSCYESLVVGWVRRHSAYPVSEETPSYFANRAFERLWSALDQRGIERFDELKSILRYLQLCVHSVIVDYGRSLAADTLPLSNPGPEEPAGLESPVEVRFDARRGRQELWEHLKTCLQDEQERTVVYASYVLDLKPRQIHEQFEGIFNEVGDIYRVKQNVLSRLRRDPKMETFLSDA